MTKREAAVAWTPQKERVFKAAMARWAEFLASHGDDVNKAIANCYKPKGVALAKACAALHRTRGRKG